ncbi:protein ROOT INITIATION DEFECTIVE 3-like isoform X2 [Mangifera indica]|uniref:protein ROOT INITIATION DEFECTIVE 3-like isoform X2 n=1 Tax=Mangifera indica TaxID=29780 RepID=UPI001CFA2CC7|nr:protein ROOT INITIATION DEFECTIVE 3-like isoform X2 [Mangifera indica]
MSSSSSSASSLHEVILTSSPEGPILAYNPSSGAALARFSSSRSPRRGLGFAGKTFIVASHISPTTASGSIHLYNWWASTPLHNLPVPEPVAPLVSTPDGSYLFTGGISGSIYVISLPSGDILRSFAAHKKPVTCLEISVDGSLLISGGDDGRIVTAPIFQLVDHHASDCTCKLWRLNGIHLHTLTFPSAIMGVTLDPTQTEIYAAGSDGLIYRGNLKVESEKPKIQDNELTTMAQKHTGMVVSVAMANEGKNLVSASEDGSVYIWEVESGEVLFVLGNETGSISEMVVVASGIGESKGCGNGNESGKVENYENGGGVFEVYGEELLRRSMKENLDLEEVLQVATNNRGKAIDMLESAISMYEKLLELILKEAMRGSTINNLKDEDGM